MLRANLSTRPFYNERLVTLTILLVAVVALALTAYNGTRLIALSKQRSELKSAIDQNESQSARIRVEAERLQKSIDRATLNVVAASTREANQLIDARTFSWTGLFGHLEKTLPYDVKLVSVNPTVEKGTLKVVMIVIAKQLDDVATLIEALNGTNAFLDVVPAATDLNEDSTYIARLEATYFSAREAKAAAAVPAADVKPAAAPPAAPGTPPRASSGQGGSR
ncbi:MAG TPA: hypothetical protein VFV98_11975 [Vicinamibacterales bacterium]|nr:hypothetical protein [Vicinamibacterales bacterium]